MVCDQSLLPTLAFQLPAVQRADAGRNRNQLQDYGIVEQVRLGKPPKRTAVTGEPRAQQRERAPNSRDNGRAVHER